jgi:hypothetical protein
MITKVVKATVHTFTDWELREMLSIIGKDEITKRRVIEREIAERKRLRRQGKYVDRTLNPKVPIKKRLEDNGLL